MTSITTNVKHSVRTTGSEHKGQNSISDPDQNLGSSCIFSSGMQEMKSKGTDQNMRMCRLKCALVGCIANVLFSQDEAYNIGNNIRIILSYINVF